jgi:hypothetical protein
MSQDHGAGLDAVTGAHEHRATLGTEYANELGRHVR